VRLGKSEDLTLEHDLVHLVVFTRSNTSVLFRADDRAEGVAGGWMYRGEMYTGWFPVLTAMRARKADALYARAMSLNATNELEELRDNTEAPGALADAHHAPGRLAGLAAMDERRLEVANALLTRECSPHVMPAAVGPAIPCSTPREFITLIDPIAAARK